LQPIEDSEYQRYWPSDIGEYGHWANPSVDSIADGLRAVRQGYPAFANAALKNSLLIRERFSWNASAYKALDCLKRRGLLPMAFNFPQ
jgi:hypothetical protein